MKKLTVTVLMILLIACTKKESPVAKNVENSLKSVSLVSSRDYRANDDIDHEFQITDNQNTQRLPFHFSSIINGYELHDNSLYILGISGIHKLDIESKKEEVVIDLPNVNKTTHLNNKLYYIVDGGVKDDKTYSPTICSDFDNNCQTISYDTINLMADEKYLYVHGVDVLSAKANNQVLVLDETLNIVETKEFDHNISIHKIGNEILILEDSGIISTLDGQTIDNVGFEVSPQSSILTHDVYLLVDETFSEVHLINKNAKSVDPFNFDNIYYAINSDLYKIVYYFEAEDKPASIFKYEKSQNEFIEIATYDYNTENYISMYFDYE